MALAGVEEKMCYAKNTLKPKNLALHLFGESMVGEGGLVIGLTPSRSSNAGDTA